jgi:hypothetical protein
MNPNNPFDNPGFAIRGLVIYIYNILKRNPREQRKKLELF